jgi:hypothetical protein
MILLILQTLKQLKEAMLSLSKGANELNGSGRKSQFLKIVGNISGLCFCRRLMRMMRMIRAATGVSTTYIATDPA